VLFGLGLDLVLLFAMTVAPRGAGPEPRAGETGVFVEAPCVSPERGRRCVSGAVGVVCVELEDTVELVPLQM
jgi:hypothetical protein